MKKLFPWMILLAIGCGFLTGRLEEVNKSVLTGTSQAIQLLIGLMGGICFWNGIMTIAKDAGLTKKLANLFSPLLRLLFHGINKGDQVLENISMNITANLMGLGNAATPSGIQAMKLLQQANPDKKTASQNMILFVVMNTAAIQLIPTTIAVLRSSHGAANPFDLIPATLLCSITSLFGAILMAKLLGRRKRHAD
ncbi:nucleoside recognition domain-containing protein [Massilioclostridium coli]|uniref:nucleoside recognition domain-containing protein n=1 Tax=Massilioclostridium coli TaxID=1870991 RepID=UPI001F34953C|nr:nucleoside recognition domain-containing protein [Massilioclostridium coli]